MSYFQSLRVNTFNEGTACDKVQISQSTFLQHPTKYIHFEVNILRIKMPFMHIIIIITYKLIHQNIGFCFIFFSSACDLFDFNQD